VAGRDGYGGSNVFWYSANSQQASVYAGSHLETAARASESVMGDDRNWQLAVPEVAACYQRHTAATARESTVSRGGL
jgi:hypothetical protein